MKNKDNEDQKEQPHSIEVETRALITRERSSKIEHSLVDIGAEMISSEKIEDSHFCPKHIKAFSEIEMNDVGSYGLRVRRVTTTAGSKSNINVKVLTRPNDHSSWRELETSIGSWESICQILEIIGFKSFFSVSKDRKTYTLDNFTIVIDGIPDFGTVIEVEQMVTESQVDKAKKGTRNLLYRIGISEDEILTTSVPRILMQRFAKF